MAYIYNQGTSIYDILENINDMLTNTLTTWTAVFTDFTTYEGASRLSHGIWRGTGGGNDVIYIHMWAIDAKTMCLDSMVGFDNLLLKWEQPGSIMQHLHVYLTDTTTLSSYNLPAYSIVENERFSYWIFANNYRVSVVTKLSTYYESMYVGFINPITTERQFPYPMYVCGNGVMNGARWQHNQSGSFVFPTNGSGYLRRACGDWREFNCTEGHLQPLGNGTVFPENVGNLYLVPNYTKDDTASEDNFVLIPCLLQMHNPTDIAGVLLDTAWISGTRDIGAEQILTFNGENYIVFDTKIARSANSYFTIKMV